MKALAWFGSEDVRMVDAPIPDISDPKDVIIKTTGTTICGSDLHLYHSEMLGMQKGDILGHEFMSVFSPISLKSTWAGTDDSGVLSIEWDPKSPISNQEIKSSYRFKSPVGRADIAKRSFHPCATRRTIRA